jgi:endonuclease YncB( thermonuclease family)
MVEVNSTILGYGDWIIMPALAHSFLRHPLFACAVALACWFAAASLHADTLVGRCVAVVDGDTIIVSDTHRERHQVRLQGIDAPEKGQRFGTISRSNLNALVYQKQVAVNWAKHDRYGRLVGRVYVNGVDASLRQLEAGLAWVYREYVDELPPADRRLFLQVEAAARNRYLGLWRERRPTPPWLWRHRADGPSRRRPGGARCCLELTDQLDPDVRRVRPTLKAVTPSHIEEDSGERL